MNDESSKYPPSSEPGGVIEWTGAHGDATQAASVLGFRLESYVATSGPDAGKFGVSSRYGDDDDWYPVTALHSDIGAALMEAHLWVLGQATEFVGSMTASQPAEQPRGEGYDVARHNDWLELNAQPKPEQDHSRDATKMIGQAVGDGVDAFDVMREVLELMEKSGGWWSGKATVSMPRKRAFQIITLLHDVIERANTPRPAVAASDLSDRYRAVMEAQGGVTDEMVERSLKILHGSRHPHPKDGQAWCDARDVLEMGAALAAHPHTGHSAVPEGWKLVPVAPTQDMVVQGFERAGDFTDSAEFEEMSGCQGAAETARVTWRAMLAAAPEVPRA